MFFLSIIIQRLAQAEFLIKNLLANETIFAEENLL
jgi:hypothetical protein